MSSRSIPDELYYEILLRLPVKSACVCKRVCKTWFSMISNPSFAKSHLDLTIQTKKPSLILKCMKANSDVIYSVHPESLQSLLSRDEEFLEHAVEMDYPFKSASYDLVKLMGSCDGLLCLWFCSCHGSGENFLCFWNPLTKEYKKLPKSPNGYEDGMIGLNYDCNSRDYKLVTCCFYTVGGVVEIYSLGLDSWTSIENVPYTFCNYREVGVLVNSDLHWLGQAQDSSDVVVCLDISDHVFNEIQLPKEALMKKNKHQMTLGVLNGCLFVHVNITNYQSEVWVMQDYGVKESWMKQYTINDERIVDLMPILIWSFKSGEIVFGFRESDDLLIYDPKGERLGERKMPSLLTVEQEGFYYESLVSLGSGTYMG